MGKYAAIDFPGVRRRFINDEDIEEWSAQYTVEGRPCTLSLTTQKHTESRVSYCSETLSIKIHDYLYGIPKFYDLQVQRSIHGHLIISNLNPKHSRLPAKSKKTTDARGGVTETLVYSYGSCKTKRAGLIVVERKRKSDSDTRYYMITVAHYFVVSIENDIGLSLVIRIRGDKLSSGGNSGYAIEGPVQHPAPALLYMMDRVLAELSWTPNLCPHCANISHPRQRGVYAESDSEDSENQRNWSTSNGRGGGASFLGNHGVNKGTGNGSVYVGKVLVGH